MWTLTTFGREPATEILMDPDKISSATVLADLSPAALKIKATRKCVGQEDLQNLPRPASSSPGRRVRQGSLPKRSEVRVPVLAQAGLAVQGQVDQLVNQVGVAQA